MKKKEIEIPASAVDSSPIAGTMGSNSLFTRREMLGITGVAGLSAATSIVPDAIAQTAQNGLVSPVSPATGGSRLHMRTGS